MKASFNFIAYLVYIPIVIALTWYVAHILFKKQQGVHDRYFQWQAGYSAFD